MWKQLYPRDYRPPNALAVALNRLGQYERAIEEAREAQRRNPEHPFPRSNLAYAYRGASRFAEARRTAEQAIAQKTETVPLRRLLYQLALLDGDAALAERTLEWGKGRAREFDLIGAQAQAVAFSGQMARARPLYERTPEMARRQGLVQVGARLRRAGGLDRGALRQPPGGAARRRGRCCGADPSAAPRLRAVAALALAGAPDEAERAIAASKPSEADDTLRDRSTCRSRRRRCASRAASRRRRSRRCSRRSPTSSATSRCSRPRSCAGSPACSRATRAAASEDFKAVLDHRGVDPFSPLYALAGLELARARARAGDTAGSRAAYDAFSSSGRRPTASCRSSSRRARSERPR